MVAADDLVESKRYLDSIVGDVVPKVRRDTFIDRGPEVMDMLEAASQGVRVYTVGIGSPGGARPPARRGRHDICRT